MVLERPEPLPYVGLIEDDEELSVRVEEILAGANDLKALLHSDVAEAKGV